jgi:4-amino-4-deoxy-L-arabinose transferase-like glycosyltransferase
MPAHRPLKPSEIALPQHKTSIGGQDWMTRGQSLFAVLATYFLAQVVLRLCLPHGLELDEAEQTYFSQWLLSGYNSQPPFYNWLQYGTVQLFGMSLATLALLKNVLLFCSYLFFWLAARQVISDRRLAVIAALGLLTIPQVAFEAQRDLSHTVAAIFGSSLFLYALLRTLAAPSLAAFALLGAALGIGAITKYNFALVPVAALLAILANRDLRIKLLDWRLIVSAVVALAIVAPHALWLLDNFEAASSHTMRKMVGGDANMVLGMVRGLGSLALAAIGFAALTVVIIGVCYRERVAAILKSQNSWTRFTGRILVISLALIVLMILFGGVEKVRDRWLTPVLLITPLYLSLKIDAARLSLQPGIKRLWIAVAIIMVIVPGVLFGRVASARLTGNYPYPSIPFDRLAQEIAAKTEGTKTVIVASDGQLAGNMRFNLPSTPVVLTMPPTGAKALPLSSFDRVIFVWRKSEGTTPSSFEDTFGGYLQSEGIAPSRAQPAILSYGYAWGKPGDQYQFGLAVLDLPK